VAFGGSPVDGAAARGTMSVLTCIRGCSGPRLRVEQLVEIATRRPRVIEWQTATDAVALARGDDGAIWIDHFTAGTVTRVDPATGGTTATVHLALPRPIVAGGRRLYGFLPSGISAGDGKVWVSTARGWIAEIDQRSARVVAMVPTPSEDTDTTTDRHGTWVAEGLAGVGFLAPGRHRLRTPFISQAGHPVDVSEVASGGGLIWALGSFVDPAYRGEHDTAVVTAIDSRTGQIAHRLHISGSPDSMVYGGGAPYVGDFEQGRLYRITPDYRAENFRSPRGRIRLVAATRGGLWATTSIGSLLRIEIR
jgi:hypothetical protein